MTDPVMISCTTQKPKELSEVLDLAVSVIVEKVAHKKSWTEVGASSLPKLLTALDGIAELGVDFSSKLPESVMAFADAGIQVWRAFVPAAPSA
jgi:hypothetical protein